MLSASRTALSPVPLHYRAQGGTGLAGSLCEAEVASPKLVVGEGRKG